MINRVILCGAVDRYGVKLSYTEVAKPQLSCTLVCEDPGHDGAGFKAFIPVVVLGSRAEGLAETLEPGDLICV
jgi:hypothetical protein